MFVTSSWHVWCRWSWPLPWGAPGQGSPAVLTGLQPPTPQPHHFHMGRFFQWGGISPPAGGLCGRHHSDELADGCYLPASGVCVGAPESPQRDGDLRTSLSAWTPGVLCFLTVGHVAGRGAASQRQTAAGEKQQKCPGGPGRRGCTGEAGGVPSRHRPGPQGPLLARLCPFLMSSRGQSNWLSKMALALGSLGEPTAPSFSSVSGHKPPLSLLSQSFFLCKNVFFKNF